MGIVCARHDGRKCSNSGCLATVRRLRRSEMTPEQAAEAFWSLVDRSGGPDACWPVVRLLPMWNGYYSTRFGKSKKKQTCHRIAYEIANGQIDETGRRMVVMHRCDNRACVNPAHLCLGSYSDNTRDMFAKRRDGYSSGRTGVGYSGKRKLSEADVDDIRRRYATGSVSQHQLADERCWSRVQGIGMTSGERDDLLSAVERVALGLCTPGEFANVMIVLDVVRELGVTGVERADTTAALARASLAELLAELQRRGAEA